MRVYETMEDAPHSRPILAYGKYAWESFTAEFDAQKEGWLVVQWSDHVNFDEEGEPQGGFVSITANPYKDYMVATRWMELPQ
jgi:hypothetical protein